MCGAARAHRSLGLTARQGRELMRVGRPPLAPNGEITSFCFSPGGEYIFAGTDQGAVRVWESPEPVAEEATQVPPVKSVTGDDTRGLGSSAHHGPIKAIAFNPRFMLLASASSSLALWIPTHTD